MKKERTAQDAYEDFGKAFDKLFAELLDLNVSPTEVNVKLAQEAHIPEIFVPPIVRTLVHRRTERQAVKQRIPTFATPDPFARAAGKKPSDHAPSEPLVGQSPETGAEAGPNEIEELQRRVAAANRNL